MGRAAHGRGSEATAGGSGRMHHHVFASLLLASKALELTGKHWPASCGGRVQGRAERLCASTNLLSLRPRESDGISRSPICSW